MVIRMGRPPCLLCFFFFAAEGEELLLGGRPPRFFSFFAGGEELEEVDDFFCCFFFFLPGQAFGIGVASGHLCSALGLNTTRVPVVLGQLRLALAPIPSPCAEPVLRPQPRPLSHT